MSNPSISKYRGSQISSASPEKTVLMLYDGAVRFLNTAINELEVNNNVPEKALYIEKTVKIVEYLHSCLDKEKGGEISTNLDNLYQYMAISLTKANLNNDTSLMKEVLNLINTLRDGWKGILDKSQDNDNRQQAASYSKSSIYSEKIPAGAAMSVGLKA